MAPRNSRQHRLGLGGQHYSREDDVRDTPSPLRQQAALTAKLGGYGISKTQS